MLLRPSQSLIEYVLFPCDVYTYCETRGPADARRKWIQCVGLKRRKSSAIPIFACKQTRKLMLGVVPWGIYTKYEHGGLKRRFGVGSVPRASAVPTVLRNELESNAEKPADSPIDTDRQRTRKPGSIEKPTHSKKILRQVRPPSPCLPPPSPIQTDGVLLISLPLFKSGIAAVTICIDPSLTPSRSPVYHSSTKSFEMSRVVPQDAAAAESVAVNHAKAPGQNVLYGSNDSSDEASVDDVLGRLGYESQLRRNRSTVHVAFMAFVLAANPYGLATTLNYPLIGGGPVNIIWGWLLVALIVVCVAASLGEITSVYPTAGGKEVPSPRSTSSSTTSLTS